MTGLALAGQGGILDCGAYNGIVGRAIALRVTDPVHVGICHIGYVGDLGVRSRKIKTYCRALCGACHRQSLHRVGHRHRGEARAVAQVDKLHPLGLLGVEINKLQFGIAGFERFQIVAVVKVYARNLCTRDVDPFNLNQLLEIKFLDRIIAHIKITEFFIVAEVKAGDPVIGQRERVEFRTLRHINGRQRAVAGMQLFEQRTNGHVKLAYTHIARHIEHPKIGIIAEHKRIGIHRT